MAPVGRLLKNALFSSLSDFATKASNALLFVLAARYLGAAEAGVYALATTFLLIFMSLAFWGLDQLLIREVARDESLAGKYVANFMVLRLILALAAFVLLGFTVYSLMDYSPHTSLIIMLVGVGLISESVGDICQAVFVAFQRMGYLVVTATLVGLAKLVAGIVVLHFRGGLLGLALVVVSASFLRLAVNFTIVRASVVRPIWRVDLGLWRDELRTAFPFIFITIFAVAEYQVDAVLLSVFRTERDVGLYGAAVTMMTGLAIIAYGYRAAVYPLMARWYQESTALLVSLYEASCRYLLMFVLPVAIALTFLADELMLLVFGADFADGVPSLRILAWTLVPIFLNVPNSRMMIVANRQSVAAIFLALSMTANVLMNLLLIPALGPAGAALAKVASMSIFFAVNTTFVYRYVQPPGAVPVLVRPALAAVLMAILVYSLRAIGPWGALFVGLVAYGGALVGLSAVPRRDMLLLKEAFSTQRVVRS